MNHWETGPATEHLDLSISGHTPLLQRGPGLEALVCLSILSPPPLRLPGSPGLWLAAGNRFAAHLSFCFIIPLYLPCGIFFLSLYSFCCSSN